MDPVLAKPADLCCMKGTMHSGEALGTIEQVQGVDTYVAKPDASLANGKIILFFPDAFGLHLNNFLMMDSFAACGYLTLGVDYFMGDPVWKHSAAPLSDPSFDFEAWKTKHLTASDNIGTKWVADVRIHYGKSPDVEFAAVGYCWGARFVCKQLSDAGICKAGAIAHPSFLNESHISNITSPLLLSVPDIDKLFTHEQRSRAVEIMTQGNKCFNLQVFSGVGHGFASRARLSDPYEKWAKEQSFRSSVDWIDFWLRKGREADKRITT